MRRPEAPIRREASTMPLRRTASRLLQLFITGALAALPLAATVAIFWWAASLLVRWLGPDSLFGGWMVALGLGAWGLGSADRSSWVI